MSECVPHPAHMTRKMQRILSKMCNFLSGLYEKYWIWNGRRGVISSPLSFVYGPAFTYLSIISLHCHASESNFKENLGIQDILIHQNSSNLVNSPLCICNKCSGVGQSMMISLAAIWLVRNFWMIDMSELWMNWSFHSMQYF